MTASQPALVPVVKLRARRAEGTVMHPVQPDPANPGLPGHAAAPAAAPACALPGAVRAELDGLFVDADQHGPRARALVARILPALVALPLGVAAGTIPAVRATVFAATDEGASAVALVAPLLLLLVLLAASCAPLTRIRTDLLVSGGLLLLGMGAACVHAGLLAMATVPSAVGAVLLGLGAARAIRRAVWVLPVLLAAGASDVRSVHAGVTRNLLEAATVPGGHLVVEVARLPMHTPAARVTWLDYVVLHLPAADGLWLLGLVDIVAIALLLGLTHLYWRPTGATAAAFGIVLVATTASASAIPVLPLLGIAWCLVNARVVWRSTRFTVRRVMYLGG